MPLPVRTRTRVPNLGGRNGAQSCNLRLGHPCPPSPIALALPQQAKPEGFAGQREGPTAPAHPAWATCLTQLMGTRCHHEMAMLSRPWVDVGILQPVEEMGRKFLPCHCSNYNTAMQRCKTLPAGLSSSKYDGEAGTFSEPFVFFAC